MSRSTLAESVGPGLRWDERFAGTPKVYGVEPNRFLAAQVHHFKPGGEVLVPGDGYGRNGLWLVRQGFRVTSVDASRVGVTQAIASAEAEGLPLEGVVADLSVYQPQPCDAVAFIYVHLPLQGRRFMHRAAWNALRPGGVYLVEAFHPRQRSLGRTSGGPQDPSMLVSAEDLLADLPEAKPLILEEVTLTLGEGQLHHGDAEVTRLLAVK